MSSRLASSAPPSATTASRELVLALEASRSWRRRQAGDDVVRLGPRGMVLEHERCLRAPLGVGLGALALARVERGGSAGRFAILRRIGPTAVLPRAKGIEGWLWTRAGGSALPVIGDDDTEPNAAILFAQPLGESVVGAAFAPDVAAVLAARSPLGVPAVYGLLLRVADPSAAETAFRRLGLERPLTGREVPPTLRRHLPTDRAANPAVRTGDERRTATSVAPPGVG